MADKRIVQIELQSNIKAETDAAKKLNQELDKTKSATRTGSRAADAALGISEGGRGLTRGASGAGGRGSERDFARQAQGLGGLVHLYATFAANIYAVTAAFGALQRAADISNLLASAETLSSRYGVSLRNVASELKSITGQAISTEEALQFSSMAASAGLTSKQMQELTAAATGASRALGRDLNDSMQRIFRGAIKLEPELLDELGIMVKVDEATKEYARSLNKSALVLTDYERRQAFVNAVIEQGNSKFKEAAKEIAANPYTQLVASIRELQQDGLSLINTVLAPIVGILAQSPTALIAAVGLLIAKLAKMAMPDLLPKAEQRFQAAAEAAEAAATRMKEANKGIAKAFEQTTAFAFISAPDQTKLVKQAADLGRKLKDSLEIDIASSSGKEPVKFSVDTEDLRKQYEAAIIRAQKNAQRVLEMPSISEQTRAEKTTLLGSLAAELKMVQALEGGLANLANVEALSAKARIEENIATTAQLREQGRLKTIQLQMENKHLEAIRNAWATEKAITMELKAQNAQMGGSRTSTFGIAASGFARGIGRTAIAAGTSLLNLLGPLAMITGTVAMLGSTFYSAGRYLGIFSDAAERVTKASKEVDNNIKALNDSFKRLQVSGSLSEQFDLKLGNLKLINEATSAMRQLSIEFNNFQEKATAGDKFLNFIKGIVPFVKTAQESLAAGLASAIEPLQKAGAINIQPEILRIREQISGGAAPGSVERFRAETMSLTELLEIAIKDPLLAAEVEKLRFKLDAAGKAATEAAGRMAQVEAATKELSNATKDYVNKLIPQTELTKVQTNLVSGFIGSLANSEAATRFLKGFNTELASLTNTNLPNAILAGQNALEDLARVEEEMGKSGAKAEEIAKYRSSELDRIAKLTTSSIRSVVVDMTIATFDMGKAAIESEKAIASLNKQLRLISVSESILGGPTRGTEQKRIAAERAIAQEEQASLERQRNQIATLLSARATATTEQLRTAGVQVPQNLGSVEGLRQFGESIKTITDPQLMATALSGFDALSNYMLAMAAAEGKLSVARAKNITQLEQAVRLSKAEEAQSQRNTKSKLDAVDSEIKLLQESQQLYGGISEILGDMNSGRIRELEAQRESLRIAQELEAIETQRRNLALDTSISSADRAQKEAELNRARETLLATQEQFSGLQAIKIKLDEIKALETSNIQANKVTTANLAYQEALLNNITTNYAEETSILSSIIALTREQAASQIQTANSRISELNLAREIADSAQNKAKSDQLALEISVETLRIMQLQAEEAARIRSLESQARTSRMKQAEQSGGVLSETYTRDVLSTIRAQLEDQERTALSIGDNFASGMLSAVDEVSSSITEMFVRGEFSARNMANAVRSVFSKVIADLADQYLRSALVNLLGSAIGAFAPSFGPSAALSSGTSFASGTNLSSMGGGQGLSVGGGGTGFKFEKGGVMTEYGPLKLEKYARGGVATSPQLALFGEGSRNEAYVPLPDNRTIPVTLTGETGNKVITGDTNIQVTINTTTGESSTKTTGEGAAEMGKRIAEQVKAIVHKELLDQARPFGLLWSNK